jgi:hypothetical protein
MDITTASPAEIDAKIAELNEELGRLQHTITQNHKLIKRASSAANYRQDLIDKANAAIRDAGLIAETVVAERSLFDTEFIRRGGWTRYFLVDANYGYGHVHYDTSSQRCSRTHTTRHYWLTSESGKTAEEVIEQAGSAICTLCFPNAPVDVVSRPRGYHTPSEIERQEAAKTKETKRLAKEAKKITNPDGSVLRYGDHQERIETIVAAERAAVDVMFWPKCYGRKLTAAELVDIERILTALAAKRGTTIEAERAALRVRYEAKCKREKIVP